MYRLTVSLLLKNISKNTSLYTDLADQGLSQLVDVLVGETYISIVWSENQYISILDGISVEVYALVG